MSSLSDVVADSEFVFRGLVESWFDGNGNLTTGFLKQVHASVDRDGGRSNEDVIKFLIERRLPERSPFVKFFKMNVGEVRKHEWDVLAKPSTGNPFHAELEELNPCGRHLNPDNAEAIMMLGKIIEKIE